MTHGVNRPEQEESRMDCETLQTGTLPSAFSARKPHGSNALLEIHMEEIPARFQPWIQEKWEQLIPTLCKAYHLTYTSLSIDVLPRRLGATIKGIDSFQSTQMQTLRGPREDAPSHSLEAFCSRNFIRSTELCIQEEGKGRYWIAHKKIEGKATALVLPELFQKLLSSTRWPESMLWGEGKGPWIRPIHRIIALFDSRLLSFVWGSFSTCVAMVDHALIEGEELLSLGIPSFRERREKVEERLQALASKHGFTLLSSPSLMDEVTGLVSEPIPALCALDPSFRKLPDPVIGATLKLHQRAFPLYKENNTLAQYFAIVLSKEPNPSIIQGNERVAGARLADAAYFWEKDCARTLGEHHEALKTRLFFQGLGSLWQKGERLAILATHIFPQDHPLQQAARYAYADKATALGDELPELQGILGAFHAKREGLGEDAFKALYTFSWPQGYGLQEENFTQTGRRLIFLDRLDTLVGFAALGYKASGSKDPLGMRRMAMGIIKMAIHLGPLSVRECIHTIVDRYGAQGNEIAFQACHDTVFAFLEERFFFFQKETGIEDESFPFQEDVLLAKDDFYMRNCAKQMWTYTYTQQEREAWKKVLHRIGSFLRAKPSSPAPGKAVDPSVFRTAYEKEVWELWPGEDALDHPLSAEHIARLQQGIDALFDHVPILNAPPQERQCRLALLESIYRWLHKAFSASIPRTESY